MVNYTEESLQMEKDYNNSPRIKDIDWKKIKTRFKKHLNKNFTGITQRDELLFEFIKAKIEEQK